MSRLAWTIFSMVATTLMGMGVIAVLVMGMVTAKAIIGASIVGFILAVPVTIAIARALS